MIKKCPNCGILYYQYYSDKGLLCPSCADIKKIKEPETNENMFIIKYSKISFFISIILGILNFVFAFSGLLDDIIGLDNNNLAIVIVLAFQLIIFGIILFLICLRIDRYFYNAEGFEEPKPWGNLFFFGILINILSGLLIINIIEDLWELLSISGSLFEIYFFILCIILSVMTILFVRKKRIRTFGLMIISIVLAILFIVLLIWSIGDYSMKPGTTIQDNHNIINPECFNKKNSGVLLIATDSSLKNDIFNVVANGKDYMVEIKNNIGAVVLPIGEVTIKILPYPLRLSWDNPSAFCDNCEAHLIKGAEETNDLINFQKEYNKNHFELNPRIFPKSDSIKFHEISFHIYPNVINYFGTYSFIEKYSAFPFDRNSSVYLYHCKCISDQAYKILKKWGNRVHLPS
jgi:hypothetical protein